MNIENLKKNKIFYIIIFIVIIVFGITYYFNYYKNSPTYRVNTFLKSFKGNTQQQRDVDGIFDMIYFKVHSPQLDENRKDGYKHLIIENYDILYKQKLESDIYAFKISMCESYDGKNFENNIYDIFTIKQYNKWFIALGVHNVPDDILEKYEDLQKMLEGVKKDDTILLPGEFVFGG
jgi:hypothetical protein